MPCASNGGGSATMSGVVIVRSLPRKTAAFSASRTEVLSVKRRATVNEPAASAVANKTAAVTLGSANERRRPVINEGDRRFPASRQWRSNATVGRASTARGAMIASSGKHCAQKSALLALAPLLDPPCGRAG